MFLRTLGRGIPAIVLLFLAFVAPAAGQGAGGGGGADVFSVGGVDVDVTGQTAAAAREKAIVEAQVLAYRKLIDRLTPRSEQGRLPALQPAEVAALVRDFSVAGEKTSAVRYLAQFTVRFRAERVRGMLRDLRVPFTEIQSKPLVVLPVYKGPAGTLLWDERNPWREAWQSISQPGSLVPLAHPLGDLQDITTVGAAQAEKRDLPALTAIAQRYGAVDVLVAGAEMRRDPATGQTVLAVSATRVATATQGEQTFVPTYAAQAGEEPPALMARAAADIARQLEEQWKANNLMRFDTAGVIALTIPIASINDWIDIRKRLSSVPVIRETDLILLSRDEVRVNLHYMGDPEQLALALAQADLRIEPRDDEWLLTVRGR